MNVPNIKNHFREYLKDQCLCSDASIENYEEHVGKYERFAAKMGIPDILKIDSFVEAFQVLSAIKKAGHYRTGKELSNAYICKIGYMVSEYWSFALMFDYKTGKNPFEHGVGFKKPQYGPPEFVDRDSQEMKQIMAYPNSLKDRALFYILYACGNRRAEACHVKIQHIQDLGLWIEKGKGGKSRIVPLSQIAREHIEAWIKTLRARGYKGEYLFPSAKDPNKPMSDDNVYKRVHIVGKKLGIKLYPRMFRRAFATHALEKGNPLTLVADWMGHDDIRTTQIYTRHTRTYSDKQYQETMG